MGEVLDRTRLLFCCVDTPPTYSGDADLSRVEAVVDELGDSDEHAIVMKSTVPVGTGRSIQRRREGLGYVSNPEFLKEGSAVKDFMQPDRVVVGRRTSTRTRSPTAWRRSTSPSAARSCAPTSPARRW